MTEQEARRLLDEARSEYPSFVDGRTRYVVRPDGTVSVWVAVGKSGHRWRSDRVVAGAAAWLPAVVRERAACEHGPRVTMEQELAARMSNY